MKLCTMQYLSSLSNSNIRRNGMASQNKNQPCNRFYLEKPAGMHWLGCNDAVSWFENLNISAYS